MSLLRTTSFCRKNIDVGEGETAILHRLLDLFTITVDIFIALIFVPCGWIDLAEILGYVFVILSTFQSIV